MTHNYFKSSFILKQGALHPNHSAFTGSSSDAGEEYVDRRGAGQI